MVCKMLGLGVVVAAGQHPGPDVKDRVLSGSAVVGGIVIDCVVL